MHRRRYLELCGIGAASVWYPQLLAACSSSDSNSPIDNALRPLDVVIIGGGLGGCAAAIAAAQKGKRVLMTEPTDWIGGQLTQQGVPPDEHRWIETTGSTSLYRKFRQAIRDYYRNHYPLTDAARKNPKLNPGNGSVSPLCHEPRVALAVLDAWMAAYQSSGRIQIWLNTLPIEATVIGDRIDSITFRTADGSVRTVEGKLFIDASEQGDLLPLVKAEYRIGAESQRETAEPHAPEVANPKNIQSFAHCFAMDHVEGEDHTIERPETYPFWQAHVPPLVPSWSGRLLSLQYSSPRDLKPKDLDFVPESFGKPLAKTKNLNLWLYRRILDPSNFEGKLYSSGITIVNWPQNDYMLGDLIHGSSAEIQRHAEAAKQLSLSLFYWLQTEAPRPDGGVGWPGLRLRGDVLGTQDGLAKYPYIRESRRIEAMFTIVEQHVSKKVRLERAKGDTTRLRAEPFEDSVGIGYYHLDLHPSSGGDNYIDFESVPFQIPLGALLPKRIENLIAGGKNIGTTHISNGCYRLHPVEWSIGEAAGSLAAFCLERNESPRGVRQRASMLKDFQSHLERDGIELQWPDSAV